MIAYYFDEMMSRIVSAELVRRGYTVVMANDVGMTDKDDDAQHLPYATEHQLVLVTMDYPFAGRTAKHTDHKGLICWTGMQNNFGGQIASLSKFADDHTPEEVQGQVFWLSAGSS